MRLYDKFAAHTFEELQHLLLNAKTNIGNKLKVVSKPVREGFLGVLQSSSIYVNWTERGKVSRVTDQGYCGSCYAHAAVSDIETSFRFRNIDV
jgi:C1A family cysteine protease